MRNRTPTMSRADVVRLLSDWRAAERRLDEVHKARRGTDGIHEANEAVANMRESYRATADAVAGTRRTSRELDAQNHQASGSSNGKESMTAGLHELRQAWLDAEHMVEQGRPAASEEWLVAAEWWLGHTRREYADAMATPRSKTAGRGRTER